MDADASRHRARIRFSGAGGYFPRGKRVKPRMHLRLFRGFLAIQGGVAPGNCPTTPPHWTIRTPNHPIRSDYGPFRSNHPCTWCWSSQKYRKIQAILPDYVPPPNAPCTSSAPSASKSMNAPYAEQDSTTGTWSNCIATSISPTSETHSPHAAASCSAPALTEATWMPTSNPVMPSSSDVKALACLMNGSSTIQMMSMAFPPSALCAP